MECERELSNLFICIVWRRLAILSIKLNKCWNHFRPGTDPKFLFVHSTQKKMRKVREVCYFSIRNENWFSYQQTHTTEDSPPLEFWGGSDQPPWTFLQNGNPTWPQMVSLRSPSLSTFPMLFARIDFSPLRPEPNHPHQAARRREEAERESLTRDRGRPRRGEGTRGWKVYVESRTLRAHENGKSHGTFPHTPPPHMWKGCLSIPCVVYIDGCMRCAPIYVHASWHSRFRGDILLFGGFVVVGSLKFLFSLALSRHPLVSMIFGEKLLR